MDYLIANKLKELRKDKNITQEDLADYYEISLDNLLNSKPIKEKEYIEISYNFFKNKAISLREKTKIIRMMEESLKSENIDELYENYKMTQNATK